MATSTVAYPRKMGALLLAFLSVLSVVSADASIYPMSKVPDWQTKSEMQLAITAQDANPVALTYTVIPLTSSLGLNESEVVRGTIVISGTMFATDDTSYVNLTGGDDVAYLSCDQTNNSNITPNYIINQLVKNTPPPKAILLYSQSGSCCGFTGGGIEYQTVFTMVNPNEASDALNITTAGAGTVLATITGNVTTTDQDTQNNQGGSNSAVAMSILYSITGLITLLFLVIIATGAIRAHRYPERYGPRSGYGGRPRQSRAKGIARAVLETIPIVKFGNPEPAKPDPNIELESSSFDRSEEQHNGDVQSRPAHLSTIPESPLPTPKVDNQNKTAASSIGPDTASTSLAGGQAAEAQGDEHLGCSICTEDFHVGEDVRVLPCNHKYHPQCIDPWLINVSGTCPLCRLDLRPEGEKAAGSEDAELAPPLAAEGAEAEPSASQRRRSRLFDLHRLRHASAEERIEALRRYRSEQQGQPEGSVEREAEPDERGRRARLADRLRDRFHIRTRAQSPGRTAGVESSQSGRSPSA